jgi:hypothetical protein
MRRCWLLAKVRAELSLSMGFGFGVALPYAGCGLIFMAGPLWLRVRIDRY